jgi:hypothetical protein
MKETFKVLNRMVKAGVIEDYAIGGAIAAIYYLEPFETSDLGIFVRVRAPASEFIGIEGFPVQFLLVFNPLTDEAVSRARAIKFARVSTRIIRAEHLVAIMLDTGRTKDYLRINMFLEAGAVNLRSLKAVLKRHNLMEKWTANEYKFKS